MSRRTWGTYHIASLWVGLSVCIPPYMLASSLVGAGMDWQQAADDWPVRRARLSLADLYTREGIFGRWNWRAIAALAVGVTLALAGLVVPALRVLYDYAWFVGFAASGLVYAVLMRGTPLVKIEAVKRG